MNPSNSDETIDRQLSNILISFVGELEDEIDSFNRPNEILLVTDKAKAAINKLLIAARLKEFSYFSDNFIHLFAGYTKEHQKLIRHLEELTEQENK